MADRTLSRGADGRTTADTAGSAVSRCAPTEALTVETPKDATEAA